MWKKRFMLASPSYEIILNVHLNERKLDQHNAMLIVLEETVSVMIR